jgi:hypothetical protein
MVFLAIFKIHQMRCIGMRVWELDTIPEVNIDRRVGEFCPLPSGYNEKVWKWKVSEARGDKLWALNKKDDDAWWNMASGMSREMLIDRLEQSVCEIAKKSYDYFHHRAHLKKKSSIYGWGSGWIDPEWHDKWEDITGEIIKEEDVIFY